VSQSMPRGGRLATIVVCLGVVFGLAFTTQAEASEPPSVWITSPLTGASYGAGATVTFSAAAYDVDGSITQIDLYVDSVWYATGYSNVHTISLPDAAPGVYTLTAVAWDDAGDSATSPGITLIVGSSGGPSQPPPPPSSGGEPSVSVTSPAISAVYSPGATVTFSATASDPDSSITQIDLYVDAVWYATAYSNSHAILLPNVPTGVYTLTARALAADGGSASMSRILTVSGGPTPPPSGGPPSVSVTSPANGATYPAGSSIPFSATASDPDGIQRIDLYVDRVWYATAYAGSHSISLPNAAAGVYTLTATAWDNTGASSTSAGTTLIVGSSSPPPSSSPPSNQSPLVSLTAPANGATFTAPASIALSATASDVDGAITQVDFFANGTILRTDTSSPYGFSWTNVGAGSYSLTAVARDNGGAATVSSTLDITVSPAGLPSTAVFGPSSNHATAVDRYVLEVFPAGADWTVANPVATSDLGKPAIANGECRADVTSTILGLAPGTYIATVTAWGSGGSARSAPSPQFSR
jgi:hypothetical protein